MEEPGVRDERPPDVRTESQKEWADYVRSGYWKALQPKSLRRAGFAFSSLFAIGLGVLFWLAASGRLS